MPSTKSFEVGLELIKKDPSKILGLTVGKHNITEPGQYIPRAGELSSLFKRTLDAFIVLHIIIRRKRVTH